jgi:hypothetical protein
MPETPKPATSVASRASCRAGESFSPPTARRTSASASVSAVGTPSAKSRMLRGLRMPSSAVELPTMSLVNMPCTSAPWSWKTCAMWSDPYNPCSSPATAANTSVALGRWVANTRASSIETATPDASSSAPGASAVEFMTSVTRES